MSAKTKKDLFSFEGMGVWRFISSTLESALCSLEGPQHVAGMSSYSSELPPELPFSIPHKTTLQSFSTLNYY